MYLTNPIVEGKTNECEFMGKQLGEKYADLLIVVISSEQWGFTQFLIFLFFVHFPIFL